MPFLEVFDFEASPDTRRKATKAATKALCDSYDIAPEIISFYFFDIGKDSYAHNGNYGYGLEIKRIFVKLHAYRRTVELRRKAACLLTDAFAKAYEVPEKHIVIYFFDREPDEVSHSGVLTDA